MAFVTGCVKPSSATCDDGTTCPSGTQCVNVTTTLGPDVRCASAAQITSCDGKMDRDSCAWKDGTGTCHDGACLPDACGNALVDSVEACDDGNTTPDDGCSRDCRSNETCGNGFLDVEIGNPEQCDERGGLSHDGCSSDCRTEQPTWASVPDERPVLRTSFGFAYDAARRTVVMFGGRIAQLPPILLHNTSEWDGVRWRTLSTTVSPTNRSCTQMAYDTEHEELVLFSGDNGAADTWTFDGAWHLRTPTMAPPARSCGGMVYDAARKRVVLFGGQDSGDRDDTWAWNGADWAQVSTAGQPSPRHEFSMAYDPSRNVIVLFGGQTGTTKLGDIWEFDGTTWHQVTFTGGPGNRMATAMAYDPVHHDVLVVGGVSDDISFQYPFDSWAWNGTTWTQRANVPSVFALELAFSAAATDPGRNVIVLAGTSGGLWEWNGTAFTKSTSGTTTGIVPPAARDGAAMVLDTQRNRILMFGGVVQASPAKSSAEQWMWTGGWISIPATSPMPSARDGVGLAYDEAHDEIVLYGGCLTDSSQSPSPTTDAFQDTWVYKNGVWAQRFATSPPGLRCQPGMTYDAKRGQVVMYGGYDPRNTNGVTYPPGTWTWNGSAWTQAATTLPSPSPTSRAAPALGYDRKSERVVMFGGATPQGPANDTLLWDGQSWTSVAGTQHPRARGQAQLGWDAARGRLVLVGGFDAPIGGDFILSDSWEWDGSAWTQLPVDAPPRRYFAMAPALDGAGLMLFGGNTAPKGLTEPNQQRKGDTWRLRWDGDARYEACTDSDNDTDGQIGCADPDCGWACVTCGNGQVDAPLDVCYRCPADTGACP